MHTVHNNIPSFGAMVLLVYIYIWRHSSALESNLSLVWGNSKPEYFDFFFVKWHFYYIYFSAFPLFAASSSYTMCSTHRQLLQKENKE